MQWCILRILSAPNLIVLIRHIICSISGNDKMYCIKLIQCNSNQFTFVDRSSVKRRLIIQFDSSIMVIATTLTQTFVKSTDNGCTRNTYPRVHYCTECKRIQSQQRKAKYNLTLLHFHLFLTLRARGSTLVVRIRRL